MPYLITGFEKSTKRAVKTVSNAPTEALARKSADALGIEVESIAAVEESSRVRPNHPTPEAENSGCELQGAPGNAGQLSAEALSGERKNTRGAPDTQAIAPLSIAVAAIFGLLAVLPWLDGIVGKHVLGWRFQALASVECVAVAGAVLLQRGRTVSEYVVQGRWNTWGVLAVVFTACSAVQFYLMEYTSIGLGASFDSPVTFAMLSALYKAAPFLASVCAVVGLIRVRQVAWQRPLEGGACKFSLVCMFAFCVGGAVSLYVHQPPVRLSRRVCRSIRAAEAALQVKPPGREETRQLLNCLF